MTAEETDAQTEESGTEETDATLDELLTEFDEETKPERTKDDRIGQVVSFVEEVRAEKAQKELGEAIDDAVKQIKGDLEIDPDLAEGYLHVQARRNPAVEKAFQNRGKNPAAWTRVLAKMNSELSGKVSTDKEATDDREAVAAAVRSASTKAPEGEDQIDYTNMPEGEFNQLISNLP